MTKPNARRARIAALAAFFLVGTACLGALRFVAPARAHGVTQRYGEAVTVKGDQLGPLAGAAPQELWVYMLHDGEWVRLVSQLDEVDAMGQYVAREDDRLDGNDVLVFPFDDFGTQRAPSSWPAGLDKSYPDVEVKVTDPLDTDAVGYFYVFRSGNGPDDALTPLVRYDAVNRQVKSRSYTLGFANPDDDGYVGLKSLSLYRSEVNLLDRLKFRAKISGLGSDLAVTEEDLVGLASGMGAQGLDVQPVISGPVRIVFDAAGRSTAYAERVTLFPGLGNLPQGGQLPIQITDLRVSIDFSKAAVPATYNDANLKEPVNIDGKPDQVPEQPLPKWREITFIDGRAVLLADNPADAAAAKVYYKDDAAPDAKDTGDRSSYGDTGVTASTLTDFQASGFPGEMVVLPVGRNVTAAQLAANRKAALVVTTTIGPGPTPGGPSPTPRAEVTRAASPTAASTAPATATPAATPKPAGARIHLPLLRRGQ